MDNLETLGATVIVVILLLIILFFGGPYVIETARDTLSEWVKALS